MKSRLFAAVGLSLVTGSFVACADDGASSGDEDLPGDIDNNTDPNGGGGKGDGFDYKNDPVRISQTLNYRLAELPKVGKLEKPVWKARYPQAPAAIPPAWADTYWPSYDLSHNNRWQGESKQSPLELYDKAFNNAAGCATQPSETCGAGAKAKWDTYFTCAGPAATWQLKNFQGISQMFDGINNDNKGGIDDCSSSDDEGPQGWWGTCHAWSPAALLEPEPQKPVTINGVTFTPGDIKALTQNAYDRTDAVMIGGRCNGKTIDTSATASENDPCRDTNAGTFHIVITNLLGINDAALVEDRTANYEVWNQPMVGYSISKQDEVTIAVANQCVGGTGATWSYNRNAKKLVEVRLRTDYLTESSASAYPVGMANNISHDDYHYILELSDAGKVIGGRWCSEDVENHPDFLWAPSASRGASNPYVSLSKVRELISKSLTGDNGGGGTTGGKVFEVSPAATIPDNNATGVKVDVPVTGVSATTGLEVTVDVTHSYRGDLAVHLLRDGVKIKTLVANIGGSADNITESFNVTTAELGASLNGTYTVQFVDNAAQDVGNVNRVKLTFKQ
jgi:hypothetical protein